MQMKTLLAALLLISCAAGSQAGTETVIDGVLHIENSAEPAQGVVTQQLTEQWRIGGDAEDDILLGIASRVRRDDAGNTYILDSRLSHLLVIGPGGDLLRTLGREGDGPGEITRPQDFAFLPDGTLGLVQLFPGKLIKLNRDGTPAGEFAPSSGDPTEGGFLVLITCRGGADRIVLGGFEDSIEDDIGLKRRRNFFVRGFDSQGNQNASYIEKFIDWDFTQPGFKHREIENDFVMWRLDVGRDGKVVACQPRNQYALSIFNPDGSLDRIVERAYESWRRTEKIRKRYLKIFESQLNAYPPGTEAEVEDFEQDVADLQVDPDGNIWVLTSRAMFEPDPECFAVYDVFDPQGHFQRQVRLVGPGNVAVDRLYFPGGGVAVMIVGFWDEMVNRGGGDEDEAEPMQVACFRID